jgi:hypothetical protein
MPKIKLTEATVAKAKHDGSDINNTTFYWDAALGNFALAVAARAERPSSFNTGAIASLDA